MILASLLPGIAGALIVMVVLWDAFETMLVPRRIGRRVRLTRYFYIASWRLWQAVAGRIRKPSRREYLLGFYAPLSLILLLVCWASGLIAGFALLQLALGGATGEAPRHLGTLLYMSGETFFTLGFGDIVPSTGWGRALSVLESGTGFGFLGTVIGYLPTAYSAFSQREIEISLLDARAGSPPTAAEFLARTRAAGERSLQDELLRDWERWSAQVLETHISYPLLAYYRSQHSNQSWLGALTAILDSSALIVAGIEGMPSEQAQLTFAMARHTLVDVTQIFVPHYTPARARAPGRRRAAAAARATRRGVDPGARFTRVRGAADRAAQAVRAVRAGARRAPDARAARLAARRRPSRQLARRPVGPPARHPRDDGVPGGRAFLRGGRWWRAERRSVGSASRAFSEGR